MARKKTDGGPSEGVAPSPKASRTQNPGKSRRKSTVTVAEQDSAPGFPVVGIGASAGGLEAFEQFFTHMPPAAGMAFVVVQHLDPSHKSILTELIQRYTRMRVVEATDGVRLEPDTVFVIPPNRYLAILHGTVHLLETSSIPGLRAPIDFFFRSLAEDQKEKAIGIVLSGTGSEGALGLRAVKGEGGMTMVQDPGSAKYDGMPRNAIATGMADFILPPDKMPAQLVPYVRHALLKPLADIAKPVGKDSDLLAKIFILVRSKTGHDFTYYKHNTILRRIDKRMAVHRITRLADYVRYLQEDPGETVTLFKELLIGVSNFFRDKEAFEVLKQKAIPRLFEGRPADQPIRIWVPGCATGEEAYSIAMICRDVMERLGKHLDVQMFATDLDSEAIERARSGIYPDSIAGDVAPGYLTHFFAREDGFYRVKREVRDMVVFALQNVTSDPPFSRVDLISCRNLLIYFGPQLQRRVLPLFHYALKTEGFLFLGSSESIGEFTDYFKVVDRKWKLFSRKDMGQALKPTFDITHTTTTDRRVEAQTAEGVALTQKMSYREVAERIVLNAYAPASVIINEKSEILFILGRAGKYLEAPAGEFTGHILSMAREGLKLELAMVLRKATVQKTEARAEGVPVRTNGGEQRVNLVVKPITEPSAMQGSLMVIFEEVPVPPGFDPSGAREGLPGAEEDSRVLHVAKELRATKEYLQTTIEELETANEELQSGNEELQSSNEELQSTNEELETSKEELQSVNEELSTVNSELQQKIDELSRISSDLNNLLYSTEIGTIFLDLNLRIQRFTPAMTNFINLIQSDIGRPVSHIVTNLVYDRLVEDAAKVLRTLVPEEREIQCKAGRWYTMRLMPYRTMENVIDGVVITFAEITRLKEALIALEEARGREFLEETSRREYAEAIVNTVREPLVVLDEDLLVESANASFYRVFQVEREDTEGRLLYELGNRQWDIPALRQLLEEILPHRAVVRDFEVSNDFEAMGRRKMLLNARRLETAQGTPGRILLSIEDVTGNTDH
jgi:two-component system, chemotaxis family, CheB/CheR fusion protein